MSRYVARSKPKTVLSLKLMLRLEHIILPKNDLGVIARLWIGLSK